MISRDLYTNADDIFLNKVTIYEWNILSYGCKSNFKSIDEYAARYSAELPELTDTIKYDLMKLIKEEMNITVPETI